MKSGKGGFGAPLPGKFGRLLMRGELNSALYGPLQDEYLKGSEAGTDVWIHKNRYVVRFGEDETERLGARMSGIWGGQSELDLYLQSQGIDTLLFSGVNADQARFLEQVNTRRITRYSACWER